MTTVRDIQGAVAQRFAVTVLDLTSARRGRGIVLPRQIAMWMARHMTGHSIPEIGRYFGNRDHSTVMHSIDRVDALMAEDRAFAAVVWALLESVDCEESVEIRRAFMRLVA